MKIISYGSALTALIFLLTTSGCSTAPATPTSTSPETNTPTTTPGDTSAVKDPNVYDANKPETWTTSQLISQTIFGCVSQNNIYKMQPAVKKGIGGVILMGGHPSGSLEKAISRLVARAKNGVAPFIGSDEEGGTVQRLAAEIYPLPSASVMGTWSTGKIENTAKAYGKRMKRFGVNLSFSPVADLGFPGYFIGDSKRAFGHNPRDVARGVTAWAKGLESAGVAPVLKHWPGHGRAVDTHSKPGLIPSIKVLSNTDLVPFLKTIDSGFTTVMVGHLVAPGLTERNTPASRSPKALAVLREEIGDSGIIITDELSMGGSTAGLNGRVDLAAVKALAAGVDVALVCNGPADLAHRVKHLMKRNGLTREALIGKVQRILEWKRRFSIIPGD